MTDRDDLYLVAVLDADGRIIRADGVMLPYKDARCRADKVSDDDRPDCRAVAMLGYDDADSREWLTARPTFLRHDERRP